MSRIIALFVIAAIAVPVAASGQSHESAAEAALRARLDSLVPAWQAASTRMARQDSVERARKIAQQREPLDTMKSGPFIAVARHSESAGSFKRVRRELERRAELLAGLENAEPVTLLLDKTGNYLPFRVMQGARHHVIALNQEEFSINNRVLSLSIDEALRDFMSNDVRKWLGDGRLNFDNDYADIYRTMTLSDVALAKRCLHQDSRACIGALELGAPDWLRGRTREEFRRVVRSGEEITPPVPLAGRASLLYYALRRGGRGSLARMSSVQQPAQAIAAAGNEPLEEVLAGWQAELNAQGANPRRGVASGAASTILWAGVALAFALRSTRRRVG